MKVVKIIAGIIVTLIILIVVVFFLLGLKSQKGSAPGLVDDQLAACASAPNCVSSEENTPSSKKVDPLSASLADVKSAIVDAGGVITTETESYIAATFMSSVFKFVDDVEVRDAGEGVIHIRSASRVGYSDRGVNRKRVEALRAAISAS